MVVGTDATAQSDIYSAVTPRGAGHRLRHPRGSPRRRNASQQSCLVAAEAGGYVLGRTSAVPTAKIARRDMTRLGGITRWETAQLVGRRVSGDTTAGTSTAAETNDDEIASD